MCGGESVLVEGVVLDGCAPSVMLCPICYVAIVSHEIVSSSGLGMIDIVSFMAVKMPVDVLLISLSISVMDLTLTAPDPPLEMFRPIVHLLIVRLEYVQSQSQI